MKAILTSLTALLIVLSSCKKSSGPTYDTAPNSTYSGTLTFSPETPGGYSTNQSASTMSNISNTSIYSAIGDSLKTFIVAFGGTVTNGSTTTHPDYIVKVAVKTTPETVIPTGTYTYTAKPGGVPVGALSIRQSVGPDIQIYGGTYPVGTFSGTVYSKVNITKCSIYHLQDDSYPAYADGTIDAVYISGSGASISSVHIQGSFTGAKCFH